MVLIINGTREILTNGSFVSAMLMNINTRAHTKSVHVIPDTELNVLHPEPQ